ncbi:uncharacterized protein LOC116845889 isoform X4 [Odontomachus brunneus]|uniref:uncharacterized protein LOC116845889 isoform X4 n=1 Tax=Odontomachus brunneus TaxID=486640 RepID=UPI0013F28B3F|nr:uncharacterized protein LOC116845889 isoform X4 [Odontomachus brunneus]
MFSRATKLIVRSLGPRQFYIGKQNFKNFFIGGAGEIGRTQSQLLRNSMKLNTLALYDVTTTNKPLPNRSRIRDYCDNQPLTHIRETKELVEETKELVEALYRLPIAEGVPTLNHSLMSNEIISKLRPKAESPGSGFRERGTIGEAVDRAKYSQVDALPKSLPKTSVGIMGECLKSEMGYSTKPAFGVGELIRNKPENSLTSSQKRLIRTRNVILFENKHMRDTPLTNKESGQTGELTRRFPGDSVAPYTEVRRQTKPKRTQDTYGISHKARTHGLCKVFAYRGLRHPTPLRRAHLRRFHNTTVPHNKSNSGKPIDCQKINDICEMAKDNVCGKPCEKKDPCLREKVKCEKPEQKKEAPKKEPEKPLCRDTCLPRGKCEIPNIDPPPKMTYEKVTCPPSKFAKLASCPPFQEDIKKEDIEPRTGINSINKKKKKKACPPPPLPKPPGVPILLCPCPPPPKIHPGACPCYEHRSEIKQLMLPPCSPKKPYSCPTGVHYCPLKKCEKLQACEKDQPSTRKP